MNHLLHTIHELINQENNSVSIILKDLSKDTTIIDINSTNKVVSASTIKVLIMLSVLNSILHQQSSLDELITISPDILLPDSKVIIKENSAYTIKELLYWMIINSDNTATNTLINRFGIDSINSYSKNTLNLINTKLERMMLDFEAIKSGRNNYTSQEDLLHTFEAIYNKTILNDKLCNLAMDILYAQRSKDYILRYVYNPIPFAHKTGELDYLIHDAGILTINNTDYYLGISIYNPELIDGNINLMGTLGKLIITYLLNASN